MEAVINDLERPIILHYSPLTAGPYEGIPLQLYLLFPPLSSYLEVLGSDLERDEDVGGEGDVPESAVARNCGAVVEEPRPAVHRLVEGLVGRVVLRLGEGAVFGLGIYSVHL